MQGTLYQTADAGETLYDSGYRSISIRQRKQESLYQIADAESVFQTADAGVSLSDSLCRKHSNTQRMQKSLYQTADAEVSLSDSGMQRTLY